MFMLKSLKIKYIAVINIIQTTHSHHINRRAPLFFIECAKTKRVVHPSNFPTPFRTKNWWPLGRVPDTYAWCFSRHHLPISLSKSAAQSWREMDEVITVQTYVIVCMFDPLGQEIVRPNNIIQLTQIFTLDVVKRHTIFTPHTLSYALLLWPFHWTLYYMVAESSSRTHAEDNALQAWWVLLLHSSPNYT